MSDKQVSQFLEDPQFQALLIACLEKLERSEPLDRNELAQQFPEFAEAIAEFLENRELLEQMVGKLRTSSTSRSSPDSSNLTEETLASGPTGNGLVPGERVRYIGQYEIIEEIARGGMGIVFKVRQQRLQRVVALKMILAGRLANSADVQRFRREAQVAAQLQHPNIVAVHEVGEHEGHHFFTMDYVEGQTLAHHLRDESLPPRRAAEIVKTVAEAIHYAHQRGTLHRDLKPANVLLDAVGKPHVTDFGLAKPTTGNFQGSPTELTFTGQLLGTPSYMSPEQAAGKQDLVGPASDLFALGATLYACLTGRAPFVADTPLDTLMQVLHKEPISPRLLNPRVPKDLETICLKCLEKEPHKRYGTAGLLTEDLGRFLDGRPVLARPIGPLDVTWRWCRRNPLGAVVVLLVLFFAVAGPVVALRESLLRRQASESARKAIDAGQREMAARREAQRRLYNSDINVVQRAYEMADVDRMQEVLQRHFPKANDKDQRTFEWYYWWQRCHEESQVLDHPGRVTAVMFSPDGQTVATGCVDGLVRLWSATDGQPAGVLKGHPRGYIQLAFMPDGSSLITSGRDGVINVWDLEQLTLRRSWPCDEPDGMSLSPDGTKLATGGMKGGVTIWDVASGDQLDFLEVKGLIIVGLLAFSPDGTQLAVGGDRDDGRPPTFHVEMWDLRTREKTLLPRPPISAMATSMEFSPDGKHLVVGESYEHLVFYETSNYRFKSVASGHAESIEAMAYSPSGETLASGGNDRVVRLWDTQAESLKRILVGHRGRVFDAAFSPSGDTLATASFDNTVRLWKVNDPTMDKQVHLEAQLLSIPLSHGRGSLLSASEAMGNALTWTPSYESLSRELGDGRPVGISRHGWLVVKERTTHPSAETQLYKVRLIDFLQGSPEVILGQSREKLDACAFAPDGSVLATASDQVVKLRSLPDGKPIADCQVHEQPILSLAFSADGHYLLSSGAEPAIKIWDRKAGRLIATIRGYASEATAITVNQDCTLLATAHSDNAVRLWNVDRAELIATLTGHSEPFNGVAFSPDGQTLASISRDGTVCLWDPAMHEIRSTLQASDPSNSVQPVWTPDGRTLAVHCDHDNKLQIWQAALATGGSSN
ncbi:MAG: protein kinase [Pirellulaceae bacterium]